MSDETTNRPVPVTINGARRAGGLTRREAMQWVMAAVAASSLPGHAFGQQPPAAAQEEGRNVVPQEEAAKIPDPQTTKGYGVDPRLVKVYKPGEVWPLTFTPAQAAAAAALADVILPRDHLGPAASEVGVPAMLDEWVSAPYPQQQGDRPVVLDGLAWLDAESTRRFGQLFTQLSGQQHRAICDDICSAKDAKPEFRTAAAFFTKFRGLCAGAYYATPPGWRAIGYEGNVALASFDGPPQEVLDKLGVTQTVG